MYEPNESNERDESFDEQEISENVGEHVERQLEHREAAQPAETGSPSYSDAGYILSDEAPTTPRRYYTPPEREEKPKPPKAEKPPKKSGTFGKVMAGLLAGLLMGSAIGVGVMGMLRPANDPEAQETPAIVSPSPTPTPMLAVSSTPEGEKSATDIYNLATSQVVGIRTEITSYNIWGQPTTNAVSGTGFIVSSDGYIITNHHVIEDAYKGGYDVNVILYNGDSFVADIVGFESGDSDIAVLKIDARDLTPVTIGDSSNLSVGETVYAVGHPLGELTYTMTRGMVSALDREITTSSGNSYTGESSTMNMFQIDAAVNSGNSGGPVYNSRGEVVGVVTAKSSETGTEGLGFAIPINDAIDIANDLITQGYVSGKPYLGITVQTMPQNVSTYYGVPTGAYVYYIEEGSCAQTAGLQLGDIITALDGTVISGSSDLQAAKKNYSAGDSAQLTVYRGGDYITLNIVFDEARPDPGTSQTQPASQHSSSYFSGSKAQTY